MLFRSDFRDAALRDTNAYFHTRFDYFKRPTVMVLVHHVLQQQQPDAS